MAVNIFALSGLAACGPAVGFALLAVILPYLETGKIRIGNVTMETNVGLWRSCDDVDGTEMCGDSLDRTQWSDADRHALRAARAMVLLGFFSTIATLVLLIMFLSYMKDRRNIGLIGGGLAVAGGVMFMIALAIFAGQLKHEGFDFTVGFGFDIVSWFTCWTGAVLLFLAVARNTGEISVLLL